MDNRADSYRRFLEGDDRAFDEILKSYRDSLTFFINRFVHDASAAEDIAIDSFMELLVHPHRYNFQTSLKTYLFMIGRSRSLDYIRRRNRIACIELSDAVGRTADDALLEEAVIADETKRIVNAALAKLTEDMQAAVHLVYFEDMSYEEAAKVMKKSRKQVDNLLYRAKAALRAALGEEGKLLL